MSWDHQAITAKWQQRWWDARIHESERTDTSSPTAASASKEAGGPVGPSAGAARPTYFLHFAYPGISGYLHVGHMRGFTYADVFTRFKRQTGHDVLFPAGFHASGIPAVAFAKEVERGEKTEYLLANGYDEARDGPIEALSDPEKVVEYFARVYTHDYWKRFGFLIDDRRNCTTIDPGYQRFIQWQFRRLQDHGYLTQKPHYAPYCPVAGPVAVDKSETDIRQGGSAEVKEFVAIRFTIPAGDIVDTDDVFDHIVLPCATLRPETLFGVTNLWIDPEHAYELVRVWKDGAVADDDPSEVWLVSQQGRVKLEWQMERAEGLDLRVKGSALVDAEATAPLTGHKVPVVAASFVDPLIATGVVMSVPGHAPFDWAAYVDAGLDKRLGEPPQIVDIPGYDDLPARAACAKHGVTSQADAEALDAATDELYADEFNKGTLNDACGDWAGRSIKAAKDDIVAAFLAADHGRLVRQFSEIVISRAGELVDIRRIPDQDFIKYSDPDWTAKAKAHAASMAIYPQRYADDFANVLDWFGDRACVRRGSWLGTEFPFKKDWIIEPIADSTFYSWYYIISLYVNDGRLGVDDLTDAFFDHVLNGIGEPGSELWTQVRRDLLHWGPVDINLGGKEHQTVHFPVWTMNMVGLMDKHQKDPDGQLVMDGDEAKVYWPQGVFVNWWVTQAAGAKISKSKGGAEPITGAAAKYGVDPMRLYYCHVGSPHVDIEWDPEIVMDYRRHVERIGRLVDEVLEMPDGSAPPNPAQAGAEATTDGFGRSTRTGLEGWLEAAAARVLTTAREAYEAYDLRSATGALVFNMPDVLRWYRRRGGADSGLLRRIVRDLAVALCPLAPHTAEEMFERAGGEGLCSLAQFPGTTAPDESALAEEAYLQQVLDDVQTVRRLAGVDAPQELRLFTAPEWKRHLATRAVELAAQSDGRFPMGDLMKEAMADPAMRERGKSVQQFVGQLGKQVVQWSSGDRAILAAPRDEASILTAAADFVAAESGVPVVRVWRADDPDAPKDSKRNVASPLKPGIALT